jgi:hypothetical protein
MSQAGVMNRRACGRQPAQKNRIWLEWSEGVEARTSSGRLVDIGEGGALIESGEPPPPGQTVWVRLVEPATTDWVRAVVVRREGDRAGLRFPESCPFDLYHAALLGIGFGGILRD